MITIGIVFYNDVRFLREAILSVFRQSIKDWKLILLDDGSSDGSLEIAKEFVNDARVTLFTDGSNKGLATRLNFITKVCSTEYLARMDADDVMVSNRLEVQLDILSKNPTIDVLGSAVYVINGDGFVTGIRGTVGSENVKRVNSLIHPSVMARTSWFLNHPYNECFRNRCQDLELWFRVRGESNLFYVTEPLLFYREVLVDYKKKYKIGMHEMRIFRRLNKCSFQANLVFVKYVFMTIMYSTFLNNYLLCLRNNTNLKQNIHYEFYMKV